MTTRGENQTEWVGALWRSIQRTAQGLARWSPGLRDSRSWRLHLVLRPDRGNTAP